MPRVPKMGAENRTIRHCRMASTLITQLPQLAGVFMLFMIEKRHAGSLPDKIDTGELIICKCKVKVVRFLEMTNVTMLGLKTKG